MTDISSKSNIKNLVDTFYQKAMSDKVIGHFFNEVIELHLDKHMPIMYNFWDSILLGGRSYQGNPMTKHMDLNQKSQMKKEHFDQWLKLWEETVNELFEGEVADHAKARAKNIADLIQYKVNSSRI